MDKSIEFKHFPVLFSFNLFWRGKSLFRFKSEEVWLLVRKLQSEGVVCTCINPDSQFPEFESSVLDVLIAVAAYLSFAEGKSQSYQSNYEFSAIVKNYNGYDIRLLKICNN